MPFKMIANRAVYRGNEGKEYQKGETFSVDTEKERDKLLRTRRARVDESKPAGIKTQRRPDPEPVVQKVETAPVAETTSTDASPKPGRYRRSDMRSED